MRPGDEDGGGFRPFGSIVDKLAREAGARHVEQALRDGDHARADRFRQMLKEHEARDRGAA